MEPGKFGPYLRELRTRRGLTQEQVAEALRVSGAAVSKWETGKCLPDLTKLETLAEVLGVGILDLMRCGAAPAPRLAPENAGPDPAAQSWRHQVRGAAVLLIFTALVIFFQYFPLHRVALVWWPSWFETGEISLLTYVGSQEDQQTAQPVLELAEQAFSDLSLTEAKPLSATANCAATASHGTVTPKSSGRNTTWTCGPPTSPAVPARCGCSIPRRDMTRQGTARPEAGASPPSGTWNGPWTGRGRSFILRNTRSLAA